MFRGAFAVAAGVTPCDDEKSIQRLADDEDRLTAPVAKTVCAMVDGLLAQTPGDLNEMGTAGMLLWA